MRKYNIVGVMSGTSMDGLDIAHMTLEELQEGKWHHSGKSSKGKPIYEIWSKRVDLGI